MFVIAAGIDKTRFTEIVESIVAELHTIKNELVSVAELNKVKEQLLA